MFSPDNPDRDWTAPPAGAAHDNPSRNGSEIQIFQVKYVSAIWTFVNGIPLLPRVPYVSFHRFLPLQCLFDDHRA